MVQATLSPIRIAKTAFRLTPVERWGLDFAIQVRELDRKSPVIRVSDFYSYSMVTDRAQGRTLIMVQFPRDALCEWAGTTPDIVALYVCGSHARGTISPDLDLAVEVEGGSFGPVVKFVLSRVRWIEELRNMTGFQVKDLELIEVSRSVRDPIEIYRRH